MDRGTVKVRGHWIMYVWNGLFIFGGLFSCYILITDGLKFDSVRSIQYLGGGIIFSPFFIYMTLWILPGYLPPGKVLFTVHTGENGRLTSKKNTVPFYKIKEIYLKRNPVNLFIEVYVLTNENKKMRFPTYNLLSELTFYDVIDEHVYPHMTHEAKGHWNHLISTNEVLIRNQYQRKSQL
ncbi:DUF5381 family protein [Fictibacillus iocasae]|uniref:DUF5381 family protein n=1 Tax=Fictibacillus iocasae TaxID=2715437 RepID=A0ABW2NNB5_9BACL